VTNPPLPFLVWVNPPHAGQAANWALARSVTIEMDLRLEAAAIGVEDEEFGQRLRVFVVKEDDSEVSEEDLKNHVKSNLARYKVPREIVFVDELPRNATGKVLKRELAERQLAD
jgi:acyl-CoA synthetase (AMP-forming)/AMP-acid ligase II